MAAVVVAKDPDSSWAFPSEDVEPYAPKSTLSVRCRDGVAISCWTNALGSAPPIVFDKTLLYFHGSGELVSKLWQQSKIDGIPNLRDLLDCLLRRERVRTVLVEYRGFGVNAAAGPPSVAKNMEDAQDVLASLAVPEASVFVMGRSVGSVPALHLARTCPGLGGLLLESGMADPCAWFAELHASMEQRAAFANETALGRRLSPLASALDCFQGRLTLIHTDDDEVLPVAGADNLFSAVSGETQAVCDALQASPMTSGEESSGTRAVVHRRGQLALYYRFGDGGHNYIWPMNWREYSAALVEGLALGEETSGVFRRSDAVSAYYSRGMWWEERGLWRQGSASEDRRTCRVM